jgi:hypothetical protein
MNKICKTSVNTIARDIYYFKEMKNSFSIRWIKKLLVLDEK